MEGVRALTPPLDYEPREEKESFWRKHFSGESLFNVILAAAAIIVMVIHAATGIHPAKIVLGLMLAVVTIILTPFVVRAVADEFRVLFMNRAKRLHRLRVRAFHPRRYGEWEVVRDGDPIALLMRPRWAEMFWASYRIHPLTRDPDLRARLLTHDYWKTVDDVEYRHRESGRVNPYTFPGAGELQRDELGAWRVSMRSLWSSHPRRTVQERWSLRRWARRHGRPPRNERGRPLSGLPVRST